MKIPMKTCRTKGSALVIVLLTVAILSFIAATMLRVGDARFRNTMQSSSWQEAVNSAEAGADIAVAALRDNSWTSWTDGNGASVSGPPPASSASTPAPTDVRVRKILLTHTAGQGGSQDAIVVRMDAPSALSDSAGQWYRVRSTGVTELPGTKSIGYEPGLFFENGTRQNASNKLRRYALVGDASGGQLTGRGQAVRTVEVIVKPQSGGSWKRAITAKTVFKGGAKFTIDSFNSTDSTKSTNGLYDAAKRQSHADVASNANGTNVDLGGGYLYGNLAVNGGTPKATQNVQGAITNTFSETLQDVALPNWSVINVNPTSIVSQSATLVGGSGSTPQRYKLSALYMDKTNQLHVVSPTPGQPSTVEIWCTKDVTVKDTAQIIVDPEVTLNIYIEGKFSQTGGSFTNASGRASHLNLIGINPSNSTTPQWSYNSTSDFIGTIYGTAVQFKVTGAANFFGAAVCETVDFGGSVDAGFHFDEALLSNGGSGSSFQVASWVEDVR